MLLSRGLGRASRILAPERISPRPSDIGLVSYPRSGNTWLRTVFAHLLFGTAGDSQADLDFYAPDLHTGRTSADVVAGEVRPLKSHDPLCGPTPTGARKFSRVVYIVRDPRDVVLSHYRYRSRFANAGPDFERFLQSFVSGRNWPGSWATHVASWTNPGAEVPGRRISVVRYEDLVDDPLPTLIDALQHIELDHSVGGLHAALRATTPEKMRYREKAGTRQNEVFASGSHFIGPATHGQWRTELEPQFAAAIEANFGYQMERFSYLNSTTAE